MSSYDIHDGRQAFTAGSSANYDLRANTVRSMQEKLLAAQSEPAQGKTGGSSGRWGVFAAIAAVTSPITVPAAVTAAEICFATQGQCIEDRRDGHSLDKDSMCPYLMPIGMD